MLLAKPRFSAESREVRVGQNLRRNAVSRQVSPPSICGSSLLVDIVSLGVPRRNPPKSDQKRGISTASVNRVSFPLGSAPLPIRARRLGKAVSFLLNRTGHAPATERWMRVGIDWILAANGVNGLQAATIRDFRSLRWERRHGRNGSLKKDVRGRTR